MQRIRSAGEQRGVGKRPCPRLATNAFDAPSQNILKSPRVFADKGYRVGLSEPVGHAARSTTELHLENRCDITCRLRGTWGANLHRDFPIPPCVRQWRGDGLHDANFDYTVLRQ